MTGYKIEYGTVGYDCWGAPDFSWDGDYDGTIYINEDECLAEIERLKNRHHDMNFRIKTVKII